MSTGMDLLDTTSFNFRAPFMFCKAVLRPLRKWSPTWAQLKNGPLWYCMNTLHGFQFRHEPMLDYYLRNVFPVTADSLHRVYRANSWFKRLTG